MLVSVWRCLFPLGGLYATPGALDVLREKDMRPDYFLARHAMGDWGDLCEEDKRSNDEAVDLGLRIFSAYELDETHKIWIITEADRSVTTILLPEEY
jgi:hypothetical protein